MCIQLSCQFNSSMLEDKSLPLELWGKAINTYVYVLTGLHKELKREDAL